MIVESEQGKFDSIQRADSKHSIRFDKTNLRIVSRRLEVQLGELASKESVLRQSSLIPFLRVTPLLLKLGNDILVGVRIELRMLEKHPEDGTPSAVKSASNPTMESAGSIAGKVETLILRSRLGNIGIGVFELVGPELTERSKLELITVKVPWVIVLKFVPELFRRPLCGQRRDRA